MSRLNRISAFTTITTIVLAFMSNHVSAQAPARESIRDQLHELEFGTEWNGYRLDTLIPLKGFKPGTYMATFILDTVDNDYRLMAHIIDSESFNGMPAPFEEYRMEGVIPELCLAFTANADRDSDPELIIQIGWHYDDVNAVGWFYNTYVYDLERNHPTAINLKLDSAKVIPREAQANRQGERLRAKYNTEAKIRRRLKQLGFKQYSK